VDFDHLQNADHERVASKFWQNNTPIRGVGAVFEKPSKVKKLRVRVSDSDFIPSTPSSEGHEFVLGFFPKFWTSIYVQYQPISSTYVCHSFLDFGSGEETKSHALTECGFLEHSLKTCRIRTQGSAV
jgi:hypothetical protein